MSAPREPLRIVVVVGGGPVAIVTAIALRKALPRCDVLVIGQAPSPASFADWSPTSLPFTNTFHDRLGIDEADIVTRAGGSYRLVTRYGGWGGDGQRGTLAYGEILDPALKTAFARDWGGGRTLGTGRRPVGSLAEALAEAGRFAPPPPDEPTPVSDVDYALRWNPAAYRDLLIARAQAMGVQHIQGAVDGLIPGENDTVAAVSVAGHGPIAADLFVDCSGPAATLLAAHPRFSVNDWSAGLPTRTVYLAQPGGPTAALDDHVDLGQIGWMTRVMGRDGEYVTLGVGADVARNDALEALGRPASAAIAMHPGRAAEPFIGNIVAIGDASAQFEPLGPLHLDLAHRQLDLLIEMLPGREIEPLERAEYNRRSVLMMEGVRESLALHFATPAALRVFGGTPIPEGVERVIDQFQRRGRIPFREESPLLAQEQFALLSALGYAPGLPPAATGSHDAQEDRARTDFAADVQAALRFAPDYAQWLASAVRPNP